jgi:ATP-dependent Zn protease
MKVCFGGRIAEAMFCDDISSGAQSDIEQATRIAKQMVLTWGMSDRLGPVSYGPDGTRDMGYFLQAEREYSESTAEAIDAEIRRITDEAYAEAKLLIEENKGRLEGIARACSSTRPSMPTTSSSSSQAGNWTSLPSAICWPPSRPRTATGEEPSRKRRRHRPQN